MSDVPPSTDLKKKQFVQEYIESGFNATKAADNTYNVGSKGGKDRKNSAAALGSRMLRDVKVREILSTELRHQMADPAFVLENLLKIATCSKADRDKLNAVVSLGRALKMFTDRQEIDQRFSVTDLVMSQAEKSNCKRVNWDEQSFDEVEKWHK